MSLPTESVGVGTEDSGGFVRLIVPIIRIEDVEEFIQGQTEAFDQSEEMDDADDEYSSSVSSDSDDESLERREAVHVTPSNRNFIDLGSTVKNMNPLASPLIEAEHESALDNFQYTGSTPDLNPSPEMIEAEAEQTEQSALVNSSDPATSADENPNGPISPETIEAEAEQTNEIALVNSPDPTSNVDESLNVPAVPDAEIATTNQFALDNNENEEFYQITLQFDENNRVLSITCPGLVLLFPTDAEVQIDDNVEPTVDQSHEIGADNSEIMDTNNDEGAEQNPGISTLTTDQEPRPSQETNYAIPSLLRKLKSPNKIVKKQFKKLSYAQKQRILDTSLEQFYGDFDVYCEENEKVLEMYGMDKMKWICALCSHKGFSTKKGGDKNDFHEFSTHDRFKTHFLAFHDEPQICKFCKREFGDKLKLLGHSTNKKFNCYKKFARAKDEDNEA